VADNSPTTLVALRADTGERIAIDDLSLETLRALSDGRLLHCAHCGTPLTLKAGPVRQHHFAHVSLINCTGIDHEPETEAHRQGKRLLYRHFRQEATGAALEQSFPSTGQRADVFITMPDRAYVLEFQQANNSAADWAERHQQYQSLGVSDIWFLGQVRYQERQAEPLRPISPYDPLPVPRREFEAAAGGFSVREMEKAILDSLDEARLPLLYYLDPETSNLTILLAREVHHNTLRAYRYRFPLAGCALRAGQLWTPLDPLLEDYRRRK
jgi:hypothetical protein